MGGYYYYNFQNNYFQLKLKNAGGKRALDLAREMSNKSFIDEIQVIIVRSI